MRSLRRQALIGGVPGLPGALRRPPEQPAHGLAREHQDEQREQQRGDLAVLEQPHRELELLADSARADEAQYARRADGAFERVEAVAHQPQRLGDEREQHQATRGAPPPPRAPRPMKGRPPRGNPRTRGPARRRRRPRGRGHRREVRAPPPPRRGAPRGALARRGGSGASRARRGGRRGEARPRDRPSRRALLGRNRVGVARMPSGTARRIASVVPAMPMARVRPTAPATTARKPRRTGPAGTSPGAAGPGPRAPADRRARAGRSPPPRRSRRGTRRGAAAARTTGRGACVPQRAQARASAHSFPGLSRLSGDARG